MKLALYRNNYASGQTLPYSKPVSQMFCRWTEINGEIWILGNNSNTVTSLIALIQKNQNLDSYEQKRLLASSKLFEVYLQETGNTGITARMSAIDALFNLAHQS